MSSDDGNAPLFVGANVTPILHEAPADNCALQVFELSENCGERIGEAEKVRSPVPVLVNTYVFSADSDPTATEPKSQTVVGDNCAEYVNPVGETPVPFNHATVYPDNSEN